MSELADQLSGFTGGADQNLLDGDAKGAPPNEALLDMPYAAPGDKALLPIGIQYQGPWRPLWDGMGRHVRECVAALAATGLPVSLTHTGESQMLEGEIHPDVLSKVGGLHRVTMSDVAVAIRHVVIHNSDSLLGLVCPKGVRVMDFEMQKRVYESTIVYTSWERSTVHPAIVEILNRCGQVWVPCQANYEAFIASGVLANKLHVIPCAYNPATSLVCRISAPRGNEQPGYTATARDEKGKVLLDTKGRPIIEWHPVTGKRFYAIGKWESRKNYHWLLGAFLVAFTPKDRVSLTVKTSGWFDSPNYPKRGDSIKQWLDDLRVKANGWTVKNMQKRLRLISERLSDEQIAELHRRNNIYVTCSHGEAFDLPAFDSRCAGNRLVYVGYGGAEEYAGADDIRILHHLIPVDPAYGWEPNAHWAGYEFDALVEALRAAQPPERRIHPPDFYESFGWLPVGLRMAGLVLELAELSDRRMPKMLREAGGFG